MVYRIIAVSQILFIFNFYLNNVICCGGGRLHYDWCLEAVARPKQISRDRGQDQGRSGQDWDRGLGSKNSASRLPRGEAVPRGTTSLLGSWLLAVSKTKILCTHIKSVIFFTHCSDIKFDWSYNLLSVHRHILWRHRGPLSLQNAELESTNANILSPDYDIFGISFKYLLSSCEVSLL